VEERDTRRQGDRERGRVREGERALVVGWVGVRPAVVYAPDQVVGGGCIGNGGGDGGGEKPNQ
jgi:hypothetical protein